MRNPDHYPTHSKQPLLTPIVQWFMLAMILANIAAAMTGTLIPLYLTDLGASIGQVGLVFTLTSVVVFTLQIMGGWISDNIGRLRAIAIGSVGGIVGFLAMLLAPTWQWMIIALAVYQIPFALVGPSFGAFLAENSTEENRGKVYGLTGTIYQVVGVLGPPLGGFLATAYGFKAMLLVATVLYVLAVGLRIWMATTMRSPEERNAAPLSMASFKSSLAALFGMMLSGGVITWIFLTDGISDIAFRLSGELQPIYLQQMVCRAHDFLAGKQLLCLRPQFGRFRRWRWSVRSGLPVVDIKSRAGQNAGDFLRCVRKQPRLHLPARSLAGRAALGVRQSTNAISDHFRGDLGHPTADLVQVQSA